MQRKKFPPFRRLATTTCHFSLIGGAFSLVSAQLLYADEPPTGLAITHNNYGRAVAGSLHEVGFTLSNFDPEAIDFTLGATGNLSSPTPFEHSGSPIAAGVPVTQLPYFFTADTSGAAGSTISVGMTATEDEPGSRAASSSFDLQLLENRTIGGFTLGRTGTDLFSAEGVLDLGRHIGYSAYKSIGTNGEVLSNYDYAINQNLDLKFDGGQKDRNLATDVLWNPALLPFTNSTNFKDTGDLFSGVSYSKTYPTGNSTTKNFNAAEIEHSVSLVFRQLGGEFSKTIDFAGEGNLGGGFVPESVSGVAISGAEVQFSGSEITIQGNSLSNRTIIASSESGNGITTNGINIYDYRDSAARKGGLFDTDTETAGIQARVMVGSSGAIAAGSETWTLSSPGEDANTARVNFTGTGVVNSGFLSVDTGSVKPSSFLSVDTGSVDTITAFDGTATRNVSVSWNEITYGTTSGVGINTTQRGVYTSGVNLTGNLSTGEGEGLLLPGQSLGNLSVGYSLEVVGNRPLYVSSVNKKAFNGTEVGSLTNTLSGALGAYTNPTVTNQDGLSSVISNTSNYFTDVIGANMGTTGGGSGTRSLTVTPEGLAGERAGYVINYNWSLSRMDKAQMETTVSGGLTAEPNFSTYEHNFSRGENVLGKVSLGSFELTQTNAGAGVANAVINGSSGYSSKGFSYDVSSANAGRSKTFNFSFDDTGLLDGTYFSSVWIQAQHADLSIIGASLNDLGSYEHLFEVVVTGRGENTGYKGFRITQFDSTSAQVSEGDSNMEILDIIGASGERGVAMEILAENGQVLGPNGETVAFTSGQVKGLDGIKFVLQSTYDEAELIANFKTEAVATLLWRNESGQFVNAVMGNKADAESGSLPDFTKVGQRFVGSYEAYLSSLGEGAVPRLGDFGYDPVANKVWAVLDHNSTFGGAGAVALGVPEPSTTALLLVAGAFLLRRKRS